LRGVALTLKAVGPRIALKEALRRLLGLSYTVNGVEVHSSSEFRVIRALKSAGYRVEARGGWVRVVTPFGVFEAPQGELELLALLAEGFERQYSVLEVGGRIVLDIGAFIGETSAFFASRGAERIYAYEPVPRFYEVLLHNIGLNNLEGTVVPVNEGLWFVRSELTVKLNLGATGLWTDEDDLENVTIKVKSLEEILAGVDKGREVVAKIDCEGCEYSLTCTSCETIRKVREYVIEVHGAPGPLNDKMMRCGFAVKKVLSVKGKGFVAVYHYRLLE
jgi:FkbM family methyltransferase